MTTWVPHLRIFCLLVMMPHWRKLTKDLSLSQLASRFPSNEERVMGLS